jgi:hypothetical protein
MRRALAPAGSWLRSRVRGTVTQLVLQPQSVDEVTLQQRLQWPDFPALDVYVQGVDAAAGDLLRFNFDGETVVLSRFQYAVDPARAKAIHSSAGSGGPQPNTVIDGTSGSSVDLHLDHVGHLLFATHIALSGRIGQRGKALAEASYSTTLTSSAFELHVDARRSGGDPSLQLSGFVMHDDWKHSDRWLSTSDSVNAAIAHLIEPQAAGDIPLPTTITERQYGVLALKDRAQLTALRCFLEATVDSHIWGR